MLKTGLLLAAITALFLTIGYMLGGEAGMGMALIFALATNFISYWFSDSIVLSMYRAQPISAQDNPELYGIIERLSQSAGIPTPKAYLIDSDQPNAFATGRSPAHGAVAVTSGLLKMLTPQEIAAVLGHEMAHIKHRDTLIMTVTATLAGAIGSLAHFAFFFSPRREDGRDLGPLGTLAVALLAPFMAMLVQLAISRTREYGADDGGAEFSNDPASLASALRKISAGAHAIPNYAAEAHPGTAHLFIMNPLHGSGMDNLFSTHPNPENRIQRLEEMASRMPQGSSVAQPRVQRRGSFNF